MCRYQEERLVLVKDELISGYRVVGLSKEIGDRL